MHSKSKLLPVDDETAITDLLEPFLTRAVLEVKVAAYGEKAFQEVVSF
jgi:DNA-binding NtrC family response regulator